MEHVLIDRGRIARDPTAPIPIGRVPIGPGPTVRSPTDARRGRRLIAPSPTGRRLIGPAQIARGAARTDPGRLADRRGREKIGRPAGAHSRIEDRAHRGGTTAKADRDDRLVGIGHRVRQWKTHLQIGPSVSVGPTRAGLAVPRLAAAAASSRPSGAHDPARRVLPAQSLGNH